jgi:hypothetical protein
MDAVVRAARPEDDRIRGDRRAAGQLAGLCGGLPLALQIIAALLNADPTLSARGLAEELAAETERLEQLRYDDGTGPSSAGASTCTGQNRCPTSGSATERTTARASR